MTVFITLTIAGTDSGPFDLYSNLDGYTSAFESGVSKASLLAGYSSALVPDYTTTIRVKSNGVCINYIDILLKSTTTTTTSSSTSTTTSSSSTTTTTTTVTGLMQALISSTSHPTDACSEILDTPCWVSNTGGLPGSEVITTGSIVYTDSGGTIPFVGDGNFYHIEIDLGTFSTNCEINGVGAVASGIAICP
jgi:hypothetical protein